MTHDDDDAVGFGRPPKSRQFRPGQSGNPSGRKHTRKIKSSPSVSQAVADDVMEELNEKLTVRENGHEKKISKRRALVKALVNTAIKGDARAINAVVALVKNFGALPVDNPPESEDDYDAEQDLDILESFVARERERQARQSNAAGEASSAEPTGGNDES